MFASLQVNIMQHSYEKSMILCCFVDQNLSVNCTCELLNGSILSTFWNTNCSTQRAE